jgi:predicted cupin superfamily sugar epimerase
VGNRRVEELIATLGLVPHPEGGYYREVFRSDSTVQPSDARGPRTALTTIYYLLEDGQVSRWHRVQSDEVWHLYEGGPLELLTVPPDLSTVHRWRVDVASLGHAPVAVVPANWWQAARPLGAFVLAGCTVAPGFQFDDFTFLRDHPDVLRALSAQSRDIQGLV